MQKIYDVFIITLFLLAIVIPLIAGVFAKDQEWSEAEKRVLTAFPQFPDSIEGVAAFFQKFENYYNDHFGFRELMILRYHREMEKRFGIAGTPLVIKGQGKWLFYTGNELLEDFRGEFRLDDEDMNWWSNEQLRRYRLLKQKSINYLIFSPPNKQTIYPEHMPEEFREVMGQTRMQQLHAYLAEKPLPFYVNVHNAIERAKSQRKLYFAMDSHWNHYGAYVAFQEVMSKIRLLFPSDNYFVDFPFHKHYRRARGGDLARMLMLDKNLDESMPKVRARKNCSQTMPFELQLTDIGEARHLQPLYKKCDKDLPKAIIFCDSFIEQMEQFFSENFSEVVYLRKGFDEKNIEEIMQLFTPDLVIEERVERNFFRSIPE